MLELLFVIELVRKSSDLIENLATAERQPFTVK